MTKNICPKCRKNHLHEDEAMNALSRKDNETYICTDCAMEEAMAEFEEQEKTRFKCGE